MSLTVALFREGQFRKHVKLSNARKRVASGAYRWREFEREIELVPIKPARFVFVGMPGSFCYWAPRPSGHYIVMQAKWGN